MYPVLGMLMMGQAAYMCRQGVYEKSLYIPLKLYRKAKSALKMVLKIHTYLVDSLLKSSRVLLHSHVNIQY